MPEWIDILKQTYDSNCQEIAHLCNQRDEDERAFSTLLAACRDLDGMLSIELARRERLAVIDARIGQLVKGSEKLLAQMKVA